MLVLPTEGRPRGHVGRQRGFDMQGRTRTPGQLGLAALPFVNIAQPIQPPRASLFSSGKWARCDTRTP